MGEAAPRGVWVDPEKIEVRHVAIGALPVVNAVLDRLGFDELLGSYLPEPDSRCALAPATAIGVLVRNLCVSRMPLYGLSSWAKSYEPSLLGLEKGDVGRLNDDRVGRALDQLFAADRASLITALSLRVIRRFGVEVKELHNDSTSIVLFGAYRSATGEERAGVRPPAAERGFSKDHRGDLLQLVEILTVSADGAVPIAHRLADGSTEDSTTHVETWDQLVSMLGTGDFVYTADCKLATRDNMDHIAGKGGSDEPGSIEARSPGKRSPASPASARTTPTRSTGRPRHRARLKRATGSSGSARRTSAPTTPPGASAASKRRAVASPS